MNHSTLSLWKESFKAFRGKSGLVMAYATVKSTGRACRLMLSHFWWLMGIECALYVLPSPPLLLSTMSFYGFPAPLAFLLTNSTLAIFTYLVVKACSSFILLLCIRSSLEKKDWAYFNRYTPRIGGYILIFMLFVAWIYIFPLAWLIAYFYLDAPVSRRNTVGAIINGAKAFWYFLPVTLLMGVGATLLNSAGGWVIYGLAVAGTPEKLIEVMRYGVHFITTAFLLSAAASWYLKIKHSFYNLFFKS